MVHHLASSRKLVRNLFPLELLNELQDVDVDKIVEAIDSMLGMIKLLGALENLEFKHTAAPAKIKRDAVFNADDVLNNFLKSI